MAKRMVLMLAVTAAIVAGLGFVKFKQIQVAIAEGAAFQPPPEAVTTIVAQEESWPATLTAIGTMAAVQGVTVMPKLRIKSSTRKTLANHKVTITSTITIPATPAFLASGG